MKKRRNSKQKNLVGYRDSDMRAKTPPRGECPSPSKIAYYTRKEAKAALTQAGRSNSHGQRLHVYLCPCRRFHLGTAALKPGPAPELA